MNVTYDKQTDDRWTNDDITCTFAKNWLVTACQTDSERAA